MFYYHWVVRSVLQQLAACLPLSSTTWKGVHLYLALPSDGDGARSEKYSKCWQWLPTGHFRRSGGLLSLRSPGFPELCSGRPCSCFHGSQSFLGLQWFARNM